MKTAAGVRGRPPFENRKRWGSLTLGLCKQKGGPASRDIKAAVEKREQARAEFSHDSASGGQTATKPAGEVVN